MAQRRKFLKAAGAGVVASMAGCIETGSSDSENEVHFLTFNSGEGFKEFFDGVAADFEEETGISVNMEYVGGFTVINRLTELIQAGDPPTIFSAPSSGAGGQMWTQGNMEPVTDIVEEFNEVHGTIDDLFRFPPTGDDDYVIPHYRIAWGMEWYRTDVYGEEGLGSSWDEYLDAAAEHDSSDLRATWVPAGPTGIPGRVLNVLGSAAGLEMVRFDDEPEYVMDDYKDGWIDVLEFMGDLHEYSNTNAEAGYVEAGQAILNQEGAWNSHAGRTGLSGARQGFEYAEQLGIDGPPAPDGNPQISSLIGTSGTGIISSDMIDEQRVENSKEFLRYMYGLSDDNPERYIDFVNADAFHYFPIVDDLLEDEAYRTSEPYQENPVLLEYLDGMIENNLENPAHGNEFGLAQPFWGVMDGSEGLAEMVHDYLIVGKSAEQAYDDNEPTLRNAYDDTLEELQDQDLI